MSAGRVALVVAAIALVVVVGIGVREAAEESGAPPKAETVSAADMARRLEGAPAPLAALHREASRILPGGRRALRARLEELRGYPVVVNIWAAWCGPCRAEMPVFQQVALSRGREIAFLGVDLRDNREAANRFLRETPVPYPSYDDPSGKVYNAEGLQGVPSTLFYDRRGRKAFVHQGPYLSRADLERDIARYALGEGS